MPIPASVLRAKPSSALADVLSIACASCSRLSITARNTAEGAGRRYDLTNPPRTRASILAVMAMNGIRGGRIALSDFILRSPPAELASPAPCGDLPAVRCCARAEVQFAYPA